MIKRTPSRNSRSKGIKVKHVLQVCLLLGVCFWLIYQVKHSHDKKKEFDEKDAKTSAKALSVDEVLKFGRKDLHPRVQEASKNEEDEEQENRGVEEINREEENKHEQEEEEDEEATKHEGEHKGENNHEEEDREDENNHEEGEQEEETNSEEIEDEGRGGDDNDIDENDQEKMDGEDDREEDILEEEKEKEREEIGEEKESESEAEGKEQVDHETSTEDQDHDGKSHEAREEHYKADDASSAVTHDNPTISTEREKAGLEKSIENSESNELEQENQSSENGAHEAQEEHYKADDAPSALTHDSPVISTESERVNSGIFNTNLATSDLVQENKSNKNNAYNVNGDHNNSTLHLEQGIMAERVLPDDNKVANASLPNTKDKSPANTTSLFNDQQVSGNTYFEVSTEAGDNAKGGNIYISDLSQQNGTLTTSNLIQAQNTTVDGATTGEVSNMKTAEVEHVNSTDSDNSLFDNNSASFSKTEALDTIGRESSNSSIRSESVASDKTDNAEAEAEAAVNYGLSSVIKEVTGDTLNGKSSINNESSGTDDETTAAVTHDQIDSFNTSIGQDVDARVDLDTLPKDIVEVVNSRDAAAE